MRLVIITQDEPFYLAESLSYLMEILPRHSKVVGCAISEVSPFGKAENFFSKSLKTYCIFGARFFLHYCIKFIASKLTSKKKISRILKENNIETIRISGDINSKKEVSRIKKLNPDLLISILGNQIFRAPIIDLAPEGCLNLHSALLPRYRGLMPTFWVMKNGEAETGVSVFFVDEGIDSGPIVVQKKVTIGDMTQEKLIKFTKRIGMEAIAESVDLIQKGEVQLIDNRQRESSYYSFPKREDVVQFKKAGKYFF